MQLKKSEDIEAPRDAVFRVLADTDQWERIAMRRGVDVQRLDTMPSLAPGMSWQATIPFRGKQREVKLRIDRIDPGQSLAITATGKALDAATRIDLAEMSPRRTRITVTVDVTARTLAARLFLQSLRLAQGRVQQRFNRGIAALAQEIESRITGAPRA